MVFSFSSLEWRFVMDIFLSIVFPCHLFCLFDFGSLLRYLMFQVFPFQNLLIDRTFPFSLILTVHQGLSDAIAKKFEKNTHLSSVNKFCSTILSFHSKISTLLIAVTTNIANCKVRKTNFVYLRPRFPSLLQHSPIVYWSSAWGTIWFIRFWDHST